MNDCVHPPSTAKSATYVPRRNRRQTYNGTEILNADKYAPVATSPPAGK